MYFDLFRRVDLTYFSPILTSRLSFQKKAPWAGHLTEVKQQECMKAKGPPKMTTRKEQAKKHQTHEKSNKMNEIE